MLLGSMLHAQKYFPPQNDTIKGDTTVFATVKTSYSGGAVTFEFTTVDIADSLSVACIQGTMDESGLTGWTNLTGTANLANTSTDETTHLYVSPPLTYLWYRSFAACAIGDTVAVTNAYLMYKKSD